MNDRKEIVLSRHSKLFALMDFSGVINDSVYRLKQDKIETAKEEVGNEVPTFPEEVFAISRSERSQFPLSVYDPW